MSDQNSDPQGSAFVWLPGSGSSLRLKLDPERRDPHWFGSLDPDPHYDKKLDPDPYWSQCWSTKP